MNKRILVAAVLGSIGVAAHAQSSVTLYGLIDAGISYVNHAGANSKSLVKYDDGVAQGSRWGLKGSEDLGGGLKAIFTLESGFNSGNGTLGQSGREFGRQAFVGLAKDGVGSVTLGRQYSMSTDVLSNYTTGGNTVAGNYAYHINDLDQLTSSRVDNSVKFTSANFSGLTFGALYGFSNQAGAFAGAPQTGTAAAPVAGSARTYSFGANYAAGPLGVGAAYTDIRYPSQQLPGGFPTAVTNAPVPAALNVKELRTFGLGARYLVGPAAFWANWTNTRLVQIPGTGPSALIFDSYEAGAKYSFTQALVAGLGYTYMHLGDAAQGHFNQVDLSLDYALSKRTDVYALGIYQKASGTNGTTPLQAQIGDSTGFFGTSGSNSQSQLAARVGIRHKF